MSVSRFFPLRNYACRPDRTSVPSARSGLTRKTVMGQARIAQIATLSDFSTVRAGSGAAPRRSSAEQARFTLQRPRTRAKNITGMACRRRAPDAVPDRQLPALIGPRRLSRFLSEVASGSLTIRASAGRGTNTDTAETDACEGCWSPLAVDLECRIAIGRSH